MADEQEVKTSLFGVPIAIKGVAAMVVVILAIALGGLIYLVVTVNSSEHVQQSIEQTREHQDVVDVLKGINTTNEKIEELVNEQNYMVLSDEKERKAMRERLHRPSSLSRKLNTEPDH